jgi:hypothetical protein
MGVQTTATSSHALSKRFGFGVARAVSKNRMGFACDCLVKGAAVDSMEFSRRTPGREKNGFGLCSAR